MTHEQLRNRSDDTTTAVKQEARRRLAERRKPDLRTPALAAAAGVPDHDAQQVFPGDWDLLTSLVLEAYHAMGDRAEAAAQGARAAGASPLEEWTAICLAVRQWAAEDPDSYTLIWGSPVPGYEAPAETMVAGARTVLCLLAVLRDAHQQGALETFADDPEPSEGMQRNVEPLAEGLLAGLPAPVIARMLTAWTQLHGMLAFDVYGHIAGVAADPVAFFAHSSTAMGRYVGLPR